jgi:glycosyltransferase involved in cell wall biosynthesis
MTAVTPSVATNILEMTGQEVITCIGNPVEFPKEPPRIEVNDVQPRAVCIARLEAVKGHAHLLAAWKLLRDRGFSYELDLVGEGSLRPELEAQTVRDGTHHLIRFCGFKGNVASILGNSLFAVLASEVEGQGIVTLEAAAMGRASVLTAVSGSIDLLPPGRKLRNGVEFGQVTELADTLEEWFNRPQDVIEEGKRFFAYLKTSSDPRTIAHEYQGIYCRILARLI